VRWLLRDRNEGLLLVRVMHQQGAGAVPAPRHVAPDLAGAGAARAPSRMTRTNNKPEPPYEPIAAFASLKPSKHQRLGRTQP
jgi:hypothetical protein